jgi:hypothetical protein
MLKQPTQTTPYFRVFKLTTGEEFIAKVTEETMMDYTLSKPLCLVPTEQGLRFAPLLMIADIDKPITVPKPVINAEPNKDILQQYETATTGVAVPKKQGIITA